MRGVVPLQPNSAGIHCYTEIQGISQSTCSRRSPGVSSNRHRWSNFLLKVSRTYDMVVTKRPLAIKMSSEKHFVNRRDL